MHFDDVPDNRQAQTQASVPACRGSVRLPESIENVGKELCWNADSVIRNRDASLLLRFIEMNNDATVLAGKLYSIRK